MRLRSELAFALMFSACGGSLSSRECGADTECLRDGVMGFCLLSPSSASRWCAFSDLECMSGLRWGIRAGDGLVEQCVGEQGADAPAAADGPPDAAMGEVRVILEGTGAGTVSSNPVGINCPDDCTEIFAPGTTVELTATESAGSSFKGWSADCSGYSPCMVASDAGRTVTASFHQEGEYLGSRTAPGPEAIAFGQDGSYVIVGAFVGSVDFGGPTPLTASDTFSDAFVVKYDADGAFSWQRQFSGDRIQHPYDVFVAPDGAVYVAGFYQVNITIGPDTHEGGAGDGFLAKLDGRDGAAQWSKVFGTARVNDMKTTGDDNLVAVGSFTSPLNLGGGTLTNMGVDAFVVWYAADGGYVRALHIGGSGNEGGNSVVVDSLDNIYVGGGFTGTTSFNPAGGGTLSSTAGSADVFVARYTSTGDYVWADGFGGAGGDSGIDLAFDTAGFIVVAGSFDTQADFDPSTSQLILDGAGSLDGFVARYSAATGDVVWAHRIGSSGVETVHGVSVDGLSRTTAVGYYRTGNATTDDGGTLAATGGGGDADIFIVNYAPDGSRRWMRAYGDDVDPTSSGDVARDVAASPIGDLGIVGRHYGVIDFGGGPVGQYGFVLRLGP